MKTLFLQGDSQIVAIQSTAEVPAEDLAKLEWLCEAAKIDGDSVPGTFIGPRREMITPWSTNAVEITQNVGMRGIVRMECFEPVNDDKADFDPMLQALYRGLDQHSLTIEDKPEPVQFIDDIAAYNREAGLALSDEEIAFLENASRELGRKLTDAELYGFAQINSEHCRHKIFNGAFVLDGQEQEHTLFELIKATSKASPDYIVSAYKDNVAFMKGPEVLQFSPDAEKRSFGLSPISTVLALKAETHNFPTTVEPFNGAATGSGGEIRDRMAGGQGGIPLIGTAIYMTAYPRLPGSRSEEYERCTAPRHWKYQDPGQILIKASNGASDFGNKFGQPLITGSVLTFEAETERGFYGYDRTIMLAGGVGYARREYALKEAPRTGDKVILLGGDNYRIGMAGGSVSSVDTGAYSRELELSAVQRANPEMQKRVYNVIRALAESSRNPIRMIHDHGAGGHMNCFAELLEPAGGVIELARLPIGDPTLSAKEIVCNESQERMGLLAAAEDVPFIIRLAERERAPLYVVGEIDGSGKLCFRGEDSISPVDLPMPMLFGSSPRTVVSDKTRPLPLSPLEYSITSGAELEQALERVLSLEGVACKDWLTNKVDRSVTGLVARQQCVGPLHLPLADVGVVSLDFRGLHGIATALGHAPVPGIIDEKAGAELSAVEALTNIVWAPLRYGLGGVSLSANWMWPAKQPGEDARLYRAVEALSRLAIKLGIPVPTGKDSLSMTMKYADGSLVKAPGTVAISAMAECQDVRLCVTPDLKPVPGSVLLNIDLSSDPDYALGGSSFAQTLGRVGDTAPQLANAERFKAGFEYLQELIREGAILAGHDISSGGVLTAVCEMAFTGDIGASIAFNGAEETMVAQMFCEKPGVVLQAAADKAEKICRGFAGLGLRAELIGTVGGSDIVCRAGKLSFTRSVPELRDVWYKPSALLDERQTQPSKAKERFACYAKNPLRYEAPAGFRGIAADYGIDLTRSKATGLPAAIIREKGTNGDREMAFSLYAAGFDVKDVTMTDLMSGREDLSDVNFIVFPGGFSNSDVLGAARGWAGAFRYNERAKQALQRFYQRDDTLSLGVCNGCQLMVALELLYPESALRIRMGRNDSHKFESIFVNLLIGDTNSVLLRQLRGARLGAWVAHGEGKFLFAGCEDAYDIAIRYASSDYPANPNGSLFNAAGVSSPDGRHLVMMPHLERSILPWQWPYLPERGWEITPWMLAFTSARDWVRENRQGRGR